MSLHAAKINVLHAWRLKIAPLSPKAFEPKLDIYHLCSGVYGKEGKQTENRKKRDYFPMQKVEKMRFRISSEVVCPVSESNAHSPR